MELRKGHDYTFSVDRDLCITALGEDIKSIAKKYASNVLGRKYYDIFPRIFTEDGDAVSLALQKNKKMTIKDHPINCLSGQTLADISITPAKASNGRGGGADVTISPDALCALAQKFEQSQQFIDIGKIASTLAHGVRSPLNAIKGAVVYLSEKYAHDRILVEFAEMMQEEIARLDTFISNFLSTSLSDTRPILTDINALLKKVETITSLQSIAYNINTSYEYGEVPKIMVNGFQIEHAILNVINNAIEAMRSGGHLTVRTRTEKRTVGDFIIVEISDTGPGMDEHKEGVLPARKGKGLGLVITREIFQYYDGHVEIDSKTGKGTTVRLFLPVHASGGVQ
ncbi:MAG TPA: ATP-binding protein [Thermodesulfovibrionales bacterium]|nr:ATP-binding protein [Thermodesulfovibrionales bacterium]